MAINQRIRKKAGFYRLAKALFAESKTVAVQVRLVSEGKLRRQQKLRYRTLQARTFRRWASYEAGDLTPEQLVRAMARLYSPVVE
jgi:hypothetical protein